MTFDPFALEIDDITGHTNYGSGLTLQGATSVVLKVEFADLGGSTDSRGKVCFGSLPIGGFRACSGTTQYCPKGPPPPDSPPPGIPLGFVLTLDVADMTADRLQIGLTREVHRFDGPPTGVIAAMDGRFGGAPTLKSFHVYKVLEVISAGGLVGAAGLLDQYLAVPVSGVGVHL